MEKSLKLEPNQKEKVLLCWFGDSSRSDQFVVELDGDGSEVEVLGLFYGKEKANFCGNVKIIHRGKNTRANVLACGVATDESHIDFSGMLRVEKGATGTRTFFRANLMILSKKAGANTFPGLEIEENDINQGGHAATVTRPNEEQLFYLQSRGLGVEKSKKLIIKGFFEPVLNVVNTKERDNLRTQIENCL